MSHEQLAACQLTVFFNTGEGVIPPPILHNYMVMGTESLSSAVLYPIYWSYDCNRI